MPRKLPAIQSKYTTEQFSNELAYQVERFSDFMKRLENEAEDAVFFENVDALLFQICRLHLEGKTMTKTQACRMVPLRNPNVRLKYVKLAEERGYFHSQPDAVDRRVIRVIPSKELLTYVQHRIDAKIDQAREHLYQVAGGQPFPKDNKPFSGRPVP